MIEQSARDNFSKLIKSLAKDFPSHAFIIRPHPALYPGYWKVKFADEKNVFVIGKGNVQPWIYGSLVTIQSGCTTAIEALACKVKTIDVSNIIGNRTEAINNSLAAQGNNKPGNIEELKYQILDSIKQESDQKRKSLQSFRWNSKTNSFKENFMQLIEENSCHIRNNIGQELGIANGDHVLGRCSGMAKLLQLINVGEGSSFDINLREKVKNYPPNTGKSRLVNAREVYRKTGQFVVALKGVGMPMKAIRLDILSTNLFMMQAK